MTTIEGTYLIAWSQTSVEGLRSPPLAALETGASWSWSGQALPLGPEAAGIPADADPELFRARALQAVRRLVGPALPPVRPTSGPDFTDIELSRGFTVSCGHDRYPVALVTLAEAARPLLLFCGARPPRERMLRIVEGLWPAHRPLRAAHEPAGVICFTAGTLIDTPRGPVPVEKLCEGDRLFTRDSGAQEILWIGRRRLSGAQMHAMPELRPVRLRTGALGEGLPDPDLVVSPRHRVLLRGPAARALFGEPEVLVAAEDLLNDRSAVRDHRMAEVTYIHLLLPRHHVVIANGVETESFHPASTDLRTIDAGQFARLAAIVPDVAENPRGYGEAVRRELTQAEARAILAARPRGH